MKAGTDSTDQLPEQPPMRVQLCGELAVDLAGERIESRIRGRQGKLLFAFLALRHNAWTTRDSVLAAVWPEAPRDRSADLSTLLSRLRSALPAGMIEGRSELRLRLPRGSWIDVEAAFEAAARAEAAMREGAWRDAWGPAHAALAICDRELLPGFEAPWIDVRRRELEDLRLEVLESVARVGLQLGGAELAAAERSARSLIELAPLRESAYVVLMETQEARGNPAEALRTYELLRARLRDDLGASPGEAGRAVHERLLGGTAEAPETEEPSPERPKPTGGAGLPPALSLPSRVTFVGRERDLDRLGLLLERAREVPSQLAVLAGEPGIGKTRLLARFAQDAHAVGTTVLYGRADEDAIRPYGPFVEALRGVAREPGPARGAEEVLALLAEPGATAVTPQGDSGAPGLERMRFFDAVSELLDEVGGDAPLVLALDDLHWADESTLLLLKHVIRDRRRRPLVTAVTCRDSEPARADLPGLVSDLAREVPVERVRVRALAQAEIAVIAGERAGEHLPPGAIERIGAEAEGNPFFALELASHMADGDPGAGLPESVSEVIQRRLARLDEATQRALIHAAILGREFELAVLEPLAELPADEAVAAVEQALAAGLLEEVPGSPDRFSFSHALVRSVLLEGLSSARRVRLHERTAALLDQRRLALGGVGDDRAGVIAEIAMHYLAALPRGDAERAISFAEQAAREAVDLLSYEEAIEHCRRGLDALEEYLPAAGEHRLALLVQLCDAQRLAGRMVDARATAAAAIEEARAHADADALARAVLAHGGAGFESAFVDETMVALLEEALAAVGTADGMLRIRLLARLAKALHYAGEERDREKRSRLGGEAMAMAERLADPRAELIALEGSHFALCQPSNLDQRLAAARRIVELAGGLGDLEYDLLGRYFLIADLVEAGDLDAADAEIADYGERASGAGSPLHRWYHARFLGMRALLAGDLEEAERRANQAFALGAPVEPKTATMHFGTQMWMLERERGGLAGLEEPVRGFVEEYPAVPAWRLGLAWVLVEQGRREEAADAFSEFTRARFRNFPEDAIWTLTVTLAAELAATTGLGDDDDLRELRALIAPYADRNAVSGEAIVSAGPMTLPLGMVELSLGDTEAAVRHLEQAAASARTMGAVPFERRAAALLERAGSTTA